MSDVTRQSFSRAAVKLQQEGRIDRGLLYRFGNTSTNPHYKHARTFIHPDDHGEWNQGPRLTLVVRAAATPELRAEWSELSRRMADRRDYRSSMYRRYGDWLAARGVLGATPHYEGDDPRIEELPSEGSLQVVRVAISAHQGDRGTY